MATKRWQVYNCNVCGNMVELTRGGAGDLVCCGQPMVLLAENTTDAAREKHVPVVEKIDGGIKVKVGSVAHPMEAKHYIEWIEVIANGKACHQCLEPGDAPEACFSIEDGPITVRALCNLHGLWRGE